VTRWSLALVLVALILVLITTATVVMASAILQPKVVPTIRVEPAIVKPGDIVVVTGEGWPSPIVPSVTNIVLVVALSSTRDLVSEGLLPVSAVTVAPDGRIAATFVFPAELPWMALREAWVVVRPSTGNLQATARLIVHRPRPTPTPTIAAAATPMPGKHQLQGTIVQLALGQGLLILRPFDGGPDRGVGTISALVSYLDGRRATLADLRVGFAIVATGWLDSAGTLLAEQIVILEVTGPPVTGLGQVPAQVYIPTTCPPVAVPVVVPTALLVVVKTATPIVRPTERPTPPPIPLGADRWVGEFYANPWLSGLPAFVREAEVIDYDWRLGPPISDLPREDYSVRWTGLWHFPRTCRYRFRILLRGASRLSVDGRVILNLWDNPPPAEYQADIDLAEGLHNLQLEFRSTGPKARIQLRWEYGGAVP
jgi:hypothetical protein